LELFNRLKSSRAPWVIPIIKEVRQARLINGNLPLFLFCLILG
jgi:hypothetical protein